MTRLVPPLLGVRGAFSLAAALKTRAAALGFAACGITDASPPPHHKHYAQWLAEGRAGEMLYLHRQEPKRGDLQQVLPGAKSVVCLAFNYAPEDGHGRKEAPPTPQVWGEEVPKSVPCSASAPAGSCETEPVDIVSSPQTWGAGGASSVGTIARYARFPDYHDHIWGLLGQLLAFVRELCPEANGKAYCDTGPVSERDLAMRAGIGWIGKHTGLLSQQLGNWFFLAELIVDIDLPPDPPATTHCGTCERCISACPTGAIVAPYELDARRCISYLTIELKGSIPVELRPLMGTRIYGCDDCLAACPWNKFARQAHDPAVQMDKTLDAPALVPFLDMDDDQFLARFRHSPIRRAKRQGFVRNVCVALGNAGDVRAVPALARAAASDPSELVREHAQWALEQLT